MAQNTISTFLHSSIDKGHLIALSSLCRSDYSFQRQNKKPTKRKRIIVSNYNVEKGAVPFRHSMSITQQLTFIYNTALHNNNTVAH